MKKSKNIFWGIALILVAALIVLSNVTTLPVFSTFSLWDIILLIVLTAFLVKGITDKSFFTSFMSAGLIYYVVINNLDKDDSFSLPSFLPVLNLWTVILIMVLLSIGFSMIFKNKSHVQVTFNDKNGKEVILDKDNQFHQTVNDGVVNIENNMGSTTKYIDCPDFRELNADNNFGAMNIYCNNVTLTSAQCKIDLDNNFGNINLYVPKEWQVVLNPDSSFGRIDFHKSHEAPAGAPIAYINADSTFGNIGIFQI